LRFDDARQAGCRTLTDVLEHRATRDGARIACRFLSSSGDEQDVLTYSGLHERAARFAGSIAKCTERGDRVVVLLPPGLDYVATLFACQMAGVICVPAYPPNPRRPDGRVASIVADCGAHVAIVSAALHHRLDAYIAASPTLVSVRWLDVESFAGATPLSSPRGNSADALAFLQYTSGSTGDPRGVMLPHSAVLHNLGVIMRQTKTREDDEAVLWVPPYHDMGLIGAILQPVYARYPVNLLAPATFSQFPVRWLQALTRYRATTTAAPNSAYDLCVERVTDDEKAGLDLSRVRQALNGAEPIRPESIERFVAAFGPQGFSASAFLPCYGLAEATLFAAGISRDEAPPVITVDRALLEARLFGVADSGNTVSLVSVGPPADELTIHVVDPARGVRCEADEVGEIWIAGGSVAAGYWGREAETAEIFHARLEGSDQTFLRTGDFGVMHDGELVVTGRLKDLVIVGGRNFYPQDLEHAAESAHPHVRSGSVAAFSTGAEGRERVVVVAEVARHHHSADGPAVTGAVRAAVADALGVRVDEVVLIRHGMLPKTSSGKLQRRLTRARFESGELALVAPLPEARRSTASAEPATSTERAGEIRTWLREYARERLDSRGMDERRELPADVMRELAAHGLFGLQTPASLGGISLTNADTMRVIEQLAAIDLTLATYVGGHNSLGLRPILRFAAPELRDTIVPPLARGERLAALALTEPAAGSNPWAIESIALPDDPGWRLHGVKSWIGSAGVASTFNVFARIPGDDGGITAFVAHAGTPGLRVGDAALTLGMRAMLQNAVHLEGAYVSRESVLGHVGGGIDVAHDTFLHARFGVAAMCLGGIKRALQLASRYATRRRVASGRLADHPATRARLSAIAASACALDAYLATLAHALDEGTAIGEDAFTICKTAAPELLWEAVDAAMQLVGGRGYIETNPLAQLLRDARLLRIFEGPTEPLLVHLGARAMRETDALRDLLAVRLQAPDVAHRLADATERATERLTRVGRGASRAQAHQWSSYLLGTAATWGAMAASARIARNTGIAGAEVAVALLEERFEHAISRCRAADAVERSAFASESLDAAVVWANGGIGDVEQRSNTALDPMLHPEWGEASGTRPMESARRERFAASTPPASLAFILGWLSDEFQIPAESLSAESSLRDHGLDSLAATRLVVALETHLSRRIDASQLWRSATIAEFAAALEGSTIPAEPIPTLAASRAGASDVLAISHWPEYRALRARLAEAENEAPNPYFAMHEGISAATAVVAGRELLNFSSYNYLGLSGHPEVTNAAQEAAERYGTSVSASRIASGERPLHRELEQALATFAGVDDALVFVGGHATNVSVLSHLFGPGDLVLCDALIHNSALQGAAFSGARWVTFPHNDWGACDRMLADLRSRHRRTLVVIEGAYGADGDIPDLARFVEVKSRHGAMLMVDEAHSLGVLGRSGRGVAEHAGVEPGAIDILMGTLSKSLASCGGYIAGSEALVEYLKYTAPGFVYSVGITPPNAAAALAALHVLRREPERVRRVQANAAAFLRYARDAGLDTGHALGTGVVPIIIGDSMRAMRASHALFERGVNVQPMISPAVANDGARLRFFVSSEHTDVQLRDAVRLTAESLSMDRDGGALTLAVRY